MWGDLDLDFDKVYRELAYDSEEEEEEGGDSEYSPHEDSENELAASRTKGSWQPVGMDLLPKYSPNAVTEYTKKGAQRSELAVCVRQHLLFLGWKIECKVEPPQARYRYTSPERSFYSLYKVCEYLKEQDINGPNGSFCGKEQKYSDGIMEVESPGIMNHSPAGRKNGFSAHGAAKEERSTVCYSSPVMKRQASQRSKGFVKPKYCPKAIIYYCRLETSKGKFKNNGPNVDMKQVRLNAKRHLLHDGWSLGYVPKAGRQELRYYSPEPKRKCFSSLLTACKSWMENGGNLREFDKLTISKEPESCHSSQIQEPESCHSTQILCAGFMENFPRFMPPNEPLGQETNSLYVEEDGYNVSEVAAGCNKYLTHPLDNPEDSGMLKSGKLSQSLIEQNDTAGGSQQLDCSSNHRMLRRGKLSKEFIKPDKRSDNNRSVSCSGGSPLLSHGKMSQDHTIKRDTETGCSKQSTQPQKGRRQQNTRLCSLIDNGVVFPGQKVWYRQNINRTPMAEGKITREGIECKCCGITHTLSQFEAHAKSTNHRPAAHIFLEDGRSLLNCQMQIGNTYKLPGKKANCAASTPNGDDQTNDGAASISNGDDQTNDGAASISNGDDICTICHYGGELVLCDHCPSCYHLSCIGLKELPEGEWFCPCCRCGICGEGEFDGDSDFSERTVLFCDQCEREYHVSCLRKRGMHGLDSCPTGNWFCSERCTEIFYHLCSLLGKSNPTRVEGLSWTILRSKGVNDHIPPTTNVDALTAFNQKIWAALQVMQECFGLIVEPLTKRDLITDVLFSRRSQLNRLNFQGFYTMILQKGEEVVSVAAIRIYGEKVAEMPLVCTRFKYRQQGMCHLLMEELEKMLYDIGVERLFLPSIPEMLDKWRTGFGFTKLTGSKRMAFLHHTFLEFQQTTMCQKLLPMPTPTKTPAVGGNNDVNEGVEEMDYELNDVNWSIDPANQA